MLGLDPGLTRGRQLVFFWFECQRTNFTLNICMLSGKLAIFGSGSGSIFLAATKQLYKWSHHWRNVWRNIAGSRPNWAQDFTRTSQKNSRSSQKNYYQHSRNFGTSYFCLSYLLHKQAYVQLDEVTRLLGGWHFIAATAIKPPKAACQFAADDILLYKFCYNIQWIYFTIWEKGKEELSPLQYHFKSLHIISRHYKKSLLRSQIYHGYEELSTDTNYPIWRRQKLPYMKKTRKKKQVCGAACFMAAEIKFSEDVRLSVTPFWLCSHHRIIMKFSGVITNDQRKVHAKGQGQRSKVKVTEVTTQLNRFRTVTPVWIHIWWWNDAYSLMLLRRGALLFFKVIRQISRSHGSKNRRIWPRFGISGL